MVNEFLTQECKKIYNNSEWEFPLNQAMLSAYVLAHFKGINLKIFHMVKNASALCDYNILASASNSTQARAMIDETARLVRHFGGQVLSIEGYDSADWILLDTGDNIIHVFLESSRAIYDLDMVFGYNPQIKIPDNFYFGPAQEMVESKDGLKNYF